MIVMSSFFGVSFSFQPSLAPVMSAGELCIKLGGAAHASSEGERMLVELVSLFAECAILA